MSYDIITCRSIGFCWCRCLPRRCLFVCWEACVCVCVVCRRRGRSSLGVENGGGVDGSHDLFCIESSELRGTVSFAGRRRCCVVGRVPTRYDGVCHTGPLELFLNSLFKNLDIYPQQENNKKNNRKKRRCRKKPAFFCFPNTFGVVCLVYMYDMAWYNIYIIICTSYVA